jgi:dTMP kinase
MNIMNRTYPGFLIVVEGIDGSGKSSMARCLVEKLHELGTKALLTRQMGGTPLGQQLRDILHTKKEFVCDMAEFLLFAADRAQHLHEVVIPALSKGILVISDRMNDSSLAYQGYGRGLDKTMITTINQWAMQGVSPDLTIYLHLEPQLALARVYGRREALTSFEQEATAFWQRVAEGYERMYVGRTDVISIDAALSPQEVCQKALQAVLRLIKKTQ